MSKESFKGDKKLKMKSPLAKIEKKFINWLTPKFTKSIEGYHLTLMTIVWSGGLVLFGWLARANLHWLWGSSLMLFMQWFTDSFDGSLGRYRDTGIPKWGFFMDHFLDFIFMSAIFVGYAILLDGMGRTILYLMVPLFGAFMVSSFLAFASTSEFKITYLGAGPTEIRIAFIILNCVLIKFGTGWIEKLLPVIFIVSIGFLCLIVFRTQKYIWNIDMADKKARTEPSAEQENEQ